MQTELIRMVNLTFERAGRRQLDHVSLLLTEGEALGIIGRDGAGKSCLAEILTGGADYDSGLLLYREQPAEREQLRRDGERIHRASRLLNNLSVVENLTLIGPDVRMIWNGRSMRTLCTELLSEFGLEECINIRPQELSLAQHQQLLMVRAILQNKKWIVIESASERYSREEQEGLLRTIRLVCRRGIAVLYASRQSDLIQEGLARTAIMACGRIVKVTAPQELHPPLLRTYLYGLPSAVGLLRPTKKNGRMLLPLPNLRVLAGDFLVVHDYDGTADELVRVIRESCQQSGLKEPCVLDDDVLDSSFVGEMSVFDNIILAAASKVGGPGWRIGCSMRRLIWEECTAYTGLTDEQMRKKPQDLLRTERLRLLLYRHSILEAKIYVIDRLGAGEADRIGLERVIGRLLESGCAVIYITGRADDIFSQTAHTFAWARGVLQEERK